MAQISQKLVLQEVEKTKKELDEIVNSKEIKNENVKNGCQTYIDIKEGRIQSSSTLAEALWGKTTEIIRTIRETEHKKLVDKFVHFLTNSESISDYNFSSHYDEYIEELKLFRSKREAATWGPWDNLVLVYLVIHKFDEEVKKLDPVKDIWRRINFLGIRGEMQAILKGGHSPRLQFVQDQYKTHLNRVHNFFIEQLEKWIESIKFDERFFTALRTELREYMQQQGKDIPGKIKALIARKTVIEKKMDKLEDQIIAETIPQERLNQKYIPLKDELKTVESEIAK